MLRVKIVLWFLLSAVISLPVLSQEILQNNPTNIKWKQIKTPGFKVIFQQGFEETANQMANTLEHIREPETRSMGNKPPKPISIVLQNNNAISNGFVTLGPRRSEFYTLPPQDYNFTGTNTWLNLLAVHEYRHIVQFQRSKTGFNKIMYYLFGESTQAGMAFSAAPRWFWEGDATLMETAVTHSGRGRIPSFDRVFRANLLEGKRFRYNKQHLGSFKDLIPDHYKLGYYMVAHIRKRTGEKEIWNDIAKSAFSTPFIPFTFSNAMKKHTDHFIVDNYEIMMDDLSEEWTKQLESLKLTQYDAISKNKKVYTDYAFPQILEDGSIVAYKSGLGAIGQLVRLDKNGESKDEYVTGVMNHTGMLSSTQYKVYWNEYEYDSRWRAKTYSVIKSYDFATGQSKRITRKSRYSGAGISPDGYKLVTILNSKENKNFIVILDAISGVELKRIDNNTHAEYSMPGWSQDGKSIVLLKIDADGKSVIKVDPVTGQETTLIESSDENIGYPIMKEEWLYYNSPVSGIDNIYAKNLQSGEVYQVTSSKYGAYNPAISKDEKEIIYNEHTLNGLKIVSTVIDRNQWILMNRVENRNVNYYLEVVEQEGLQNLMDNIPQTQYKATKYSKLGHMINIHSWGPYATTDLNTAQIGIFSSDVLRTTSMSLGYTYDITEQTGYASAKVSYQGLYPIIDMEVQTGNRQTTSYTWKENTLLGGLRIPLLLTHNKYHRNLTFSNSIGFRQVSDFKSKTSANGRDNFGLGIVNYSDGSPSDTVRIFQVDGSQLDNGEMIFNDFEISYSNLLKRSPRDFLSKWGQSITLIQLNTISGDFDGATTGIRSAFYFPGFLKHHSLNFKLGYQSRNVTVSPDNYTFRNVIFKPRGHAYPSENNFTSIQTNYALPLWYADVAIGPIINIKRIKANFFYDYGKDEVTRNYFFGEDHAPDNFGDFFNDELILSNYISYGIELTADFNLMRFPANIEMGVRVLNKEANAWNSGGTTLEIIFGGITF